VHTLGKSWRQVYKLVQIFAMDFWCFYGMVQTYAEHFGEAFRAFFATPVVSRLPPPAALVLAREQGFQRGEAWGTIFGGWTLAEQGQGVEGVAQIRQGFTA
jgi:hypothetical protein